MSEVISSSTAICGGFITFSGTDLQEKHGITNDSPDAFYKDIISLVRPDQMRWKATDWNNPTKWVSRGRGLRP